MTAPMIRAGTGITGLLRCSCWPLLSLRSSALSCRSLCTGARVPEPRYTQGQSPEPRIREYFYYLDHQGQVSYPPYVDRRVCCS